MSDSLRDQLLQAGFAAPKAEQSRKTKTAKPARHHAGGKKTKSGTGTRGTQQSRQTQQHQSNSSQADAAIQQRKALKAQIKTLIETTAIKDFAGEIAFRFTVRNRIRELYVKEDIRVQLVTGTLVITRLNGTTQLVPKATAEQILALNPEWAVFGPGRVRPGRVRPGRVRPGGDSSNHDQQNADQRHSSEIDEEDDDYADYQVPDDLVW